MTQTTSIADGTYFLFPEGSAWIAATFRGGELRDTAYEADAAAHDAANDQWGGVGPQDADRELPAAEADPIIDVVMGEETNHELVVVTRAAE